MSDTLIEQLKDADMMLDIAGYLLTSPVRKAIKDAITELDRLEAEVKKPIPDDLVKVLRYLNGEDSLDGFTYGDGAPPNQGRFWWRRYLRPFLPTPDVVPPPTWTVTHHEDGYLISGPVGSAIIKRTGVQDNDVLCGLLGSLARPDVVPSTEPVQAAGDTAGDATKPEVYVLDTSQIAGPALHGLEQFLSIFRHGGQVDILGRRDGKEYRFQADWAKYLKPLFAPASPSDQGQGSGTPMNTETAEKPKPVSLEEAFKIKFGVSLSEWMTGGYIPPGVEVVGWIIRTLDQERGV